MSCNIFLALYASTDQILPGFTSAGFGLVLNDFIYHLVGILFSFSELIIS